ncbi:MAG: hypothetical protein GY724_06655 [Actinomycetia bacterium]|nr:hypothetical protein [Actinomycetes bacterium]
MMCPAPTANPTMSPKIRVMRYQVLADGQPPGWSELTEFRRSDGSVTYLMVEFLGFFANGLDRFVTASFTGDGDFDGGHWIATSQDGGDFDYVYSHDGRTLAGRARDRERGTVTTRVPSSPKRVPIGFFGPLESLVVGRFDRSGPSEQTIAAIGVEDGHHEALDVKVECLGRETITVAAGTFETTRYRSERYGNTMHWLDDDAVVVRWESEGGAQRWDLEQAPGPFTVLRDTENPAASGRYDITKDDGEQVGSVDWRFRRQDDGTLLLESEGGDDHHVSTFVGELTVDGRLRRALEWVRPPEGDLGGALFATFFHRENAYLMRMTDGALPYLQQITIDRPYAYQPLYMPAAATLWLRNEARQPGEERTVALSTFERSPTGSLFQRDAQLVYRPLGGEQEQHQFVLGYPAGWFKGMLEFKTDDLFIPQYAGLMTRHGLRHFRLVALEVNDPAAFNPNS